MSEFAWTDTSENLVEYRKRWTSNAGLIQRFLCSKNAILGMLALSIVVGAAAAQWLSPIQRGMLGYMLTALGLSVVIVMILAAILISVITPMVHKRVCGVADPRQLQ